MGPYLDLNMLAVIGSLVALCAFSMLVGSARLAGAAAILLLNWVACSGAVLITAEPYPVLPFAVIDYLSGYALYVLMPLAGNGYRSRYQVILMLTYAAECVVHAARSWNETAAMIAAGWDVLKWIGWAQIAIGFVWGVCEFVRRGGRRGYTVAQRSSPPNQPGVVGHRRRMGQSDR